MTCGIIFAEEKGKAVQVKGWGGGGERLRDRGLEGSYLYSLWKSC